MRYLKSFNEAKSKEPNIEQIEEFCDDFDISISRIHPDGTVDVTGDVNFNANYEAMDSYKQLPIKFGEISGDFVFTDDCNLTTLEGTPHTVGGDFFITSYKLTSLIGGPKYVGGSYDISESPNITSLKGIAEYIGGSLCISGTGIKDMKGAPKEIRGLLDASILHLTSLEGCPEVVEGDFFLDSELPSLRGIPKRVPTIYIASSILWDPTGLRESTCERIYFMDPIPPLLELVDLFSEIMIPYMKLKNPQATEVFQRFKESLDYNYIRGTTEHPQLDLFRFKEALSEFDIDLNKKWATGRVKTLQNYNFVDDRGIVVDFDGNPI